MIHARRVDELSYNLIAIVDAEGNRVMPSRKINLREVVATLHKAMRLAR